MRLTDLVKPVGGWAESKGLEPEIPLDEILAIGLGLGAGVAVAWPLMHPELPMASRATEILEPTQEKILEIEKALIDKIPDLSADDLLEIIPMLL